MLSHYREERRADGSKHYVQTQLQDRKEFISDILSKENTLIYICGMKGMESGIYTELLKQGFDEYLDIRRELPEDLDEIPRDKLSGYVKPGIRTFEEVYYVFHSPSILSALRLIEGTPSRVTKL